MDYKFEYAIIAKIKGVNKRFLIWQYSKHYDPDEELTKEGKKIFSYTEEAYGVQHSQTAIQWILGIKRDLKLGKNKKDYFKHNMIKDGMFNPHYRLNSESYPDVWFPIEDVEEIYFEMHNYEYDEVSPHPNVE